MVIAFNKIKTNTYKLAKISGMKAEAVFYAKGKILNSLGSDLSLQQLQEAAMLPGVISPVIGMPDIHQGFGLPIGGVMATDGLISVGAVGMDINCGVRLLLSNLTYKENQFSPNKLQLLVHQIEKLIPVGLGGKHKNRINLSLERVCEQGVEYLVKEGFTPKKDLDNIEEYGRMQEADFSALTDRAKERTIKQLGTLGSGNHFIEIQKVEEILDDALAQEWGISQDQICLMIHSGSRALGHQTCNDYTNIFWKARTKYKIEIPRIGLASLPIETAEGKKYFGAMSACVNFAFCNRAMMTYFIRQIFKKNFNTQLDLLYDVAHNIAKWEIHRGKKMLIHRKGATRALPGFPAIVPGSMGTASYVMVGLAKNEETFASINHGAGRLMSRGEARRTIKKDRFDSQMQNIVYNKPFQLISDEAPDAYKDIEEVIDTLVEIGLTKKVAKLKPLAVIKGN